MLIAPALRQTPLFDVYIRRYCQSHSSSRWLALAQVRVLLWQGRRKHKVRLRTAGCPETLSLLPLPYTTTYRWKARLSVLYFTDSNAFLLLRTGM